MHTLRTHLIAAIVCIGSCLATSVIAQNKSGLLTGEILDKELNTPLEFVTVRLPELSLWAVTDQQGMFSIPSIKDGTYTYEISLLGFQKETGSVTLKNGRATLKIKLAPLSLALKDVVVTAQQKRNGSTSLIDQTAIQHLQPKSLDDLLQLLPGNVTKNPDLNSVGQAALREITSDRNNAMGTHIVVNGAPLSNDANMQVLSTAKSGVSLNAQSTGGGGVDLRIISPDNIASVEVIKGIPSVEYGNLTSGAIIVKTKTGATPLEAKAKIDPNSKMVYAGKGFMLGKKRGVVNLSADYSQSYAEIWQKSKGFDRITGNAGYSNTFFTTSSPLVFNAYVSYFRNINSEKSDPQLQKYERIKNENSGVRLNINGDWRLNKRFLSTLSYNLSAGYSHQKDFRNEEIILQSGVTPISDSYITQEYQSHFVNASYYSPYTVDGRPVNLYAQLKADKLIQFSSSAFTTLKIGAEWKYDVNKGDGLTFDPMLPPSVNGIQSVRPRAFKDIPAINQVSYFLEDKLQLPIGNTMLKAQAGVRLSTLFISETAHRDNMFLADPRINLEYQILNRKNNRFFDHLSVSGGFGLASKAPSLLYLYPEKAYFDAPSLATFLNGDVKRGFCVMTTHVVDDTSNPDLKPATAKKFEVGLSARRGQFDGNINFFYEKTENEFGFSTVPYIMNYRKYTIPAGVDQLQYTDNGVQYRKDGIWQPAPTAPHTLFYAYNRPDNRYQTVKKGIEYSLNIGEIPFTKTTLVVDGAWLRIKRQSTEAQFTRITDSYNQDVYPYMPLMPAGSGQLDERINTNFRFITHIPQLKLVFSTTAQVIWKWTTRQIYEDTDGNPVYEKNNDPLDQNQEKFLTAPIGFIDKDGAFSYWDPAYKNDLKYTLMMGRYGHDNYFGTEKYPAHIILNFRLTKEIGRMIDLSFVANNFLKLRKRVKRTTSLGYADLTIPLYFGAELKLKF